LLDTLPEIEQAREELAGMLNELTTGNPTIERAAAIRQFGSRSCGVDVDRLAKMLKQLLSDRVFIGSKSNRADVDAVTAGYEKARNEARKLRAAAAKLEAEAEAAERAAQVKVRRFEQAESRVAAVTGGRIHEADALNAAEYANKILSAAYRLAK
jgi:hypothetical protein